MTADLLPIVERFDGRRIVLVGDFMLDRYIFGDAERISPEAPVPVLRVVERQDRVGGAGAVAQMIATLGAHVRCFGLLGRDAHGERVAAQLAAAGADVRGLLRSDDRPTITKTRLIGLAEHRHRQQILRVDDEVAAPAGDSDAARLLEMVRAALVDAEVVCLEDYGKGALSAATCRAIIAAAREAGIPALVDPARGCDWNKYAGATLMTPNRAELEHGVGRGLDDGAIESAARQVVGALRLDAMCVTLGRDGALLVRPTSEAQRFPTQPRAVYDNTGAGDAVLAMMTVAVAAGAGYEHAVALANVAGGLEVSKFGVVPIGRDEVVRELERGQAQRRGKLRRLDELLAELQARRQRGEMVVFTNGCFDLLHPGHVDLLERARAMGSLLVVGVNSDASVRAQGKGPGRPVRSEQHRVRMLAALEAVDYIVLFDDASVLSLVQQVRPDVLVKGGDYRLDEVVGGREVLAAGGRVELAPLVAGFSTTAELEAIRASR